MTEFSTSGTLELELGAGEGRRLQRQLENAVSPVSIQGQIEQHGGGGASQRAAGGSRQRQRARREHRWQRERTGHLEDILEAVRDIDGGGGSGLSLSRAGLTGGLAGGLGGMLPGFSLGGLGGLAGAAGRAAGPFGAAAGMPHLTEPIADWIHEDLLGGRDIRDALPGINSDETVIDQIDMPEFEFPDLPSLSSLDWPATPDWLSDSLDAPDWWTKLRDHQVGVGDWWHAVRDHNIGVGDWWSELRDYGIKVGDWWSELRDYGVKVDDWWSDLRDFELPRPTWVETLMDAVESFDTGGLDPREWDTGGVGVGLDPGVDVPTPDRGSESDVGTVENTTDFGGVVFDIDTNLSDVRDEIERDLEQQQEELSRRIDDEITYLENQLTRRR